MMKWPKQSVALANEWSFVQDEKADIRLDLNENQFIGADKLANLVEAIDFSRIHQYPNYRDLYGALELETSLPHDQILITNGADQAIELVIRSLDPNLKSILAVPTFSYYQHVLTLEGTKTDKIFYSEDLLLNADVIVDSITPETSSVLLTSPSNPLTTEISSSQLVKILNKALDSNVLVVVDEVYAGFLGSNFAYLLDDYSNLILIRSFSKFHGLASVRVGYILASPQIVSELGKIRGPWDITGFAAQLVQLAVSNQYWFDYLPQMEHNRAEVTTLLQSIGARVVPSKVNFCLFFHKEAKFLYEYLRKAGVLLSDLSQYPDSGELLKNALRMSVPNNSQLETLRTVLKEFSK